MSIYKKPILSRIGFSYDKRYVIYGSIKISC